VIAVLGEFGAAEIGRLEMRRRRIMLFLCGFWKAVLRAGIEIALHFAFNVHLVCLSFGLWRVNMSRWYGDVLHGAIPI